MALKQIWQMFVEWQAIVDLPLIQESTIAWIGQFFM